MSYKLYTTYISNLKNIPNDIKSNSLIAIIMRFPLFYPKEDNIVLVPELSPNTDIFTEYKKTHNWSVFENKFKEQMFNDDITIGALNNLMAVLDSEDGNDVVLVCCEKNNEFCHRRLIGEYLKSLGYEWKELKHN